MGKEQQLDKFIADKEKPLLGSLCPSLYSLLMLLYTMQKLHLCVWSSDFYRPISEMEMDRLDSSP